ncbi:MAG: LysE family translocator [Desulfarculaceae bacterium]|nr:LysE family translocator [Desulfarculaceae bacterium]MCF8071766.1 LysE family translocator [Desulfarculaceae bacterium]MCF8101316.1 LysE family translocator [Desulfarculaceae bacterium]MCF8117275.1 LysE family translocator [Desulfarculaceae bacterium]
MSPMPDPASLGAWSLLATSFVIGLSGAVMPGPVLAVTVTHAARQGVIAGPLVVLGHAILEAALLGALVLGLAPVLTNPTVAGVIGGVGALILVWLAWGMFRALPGLSLELESGKTRAAGPVRDGLLLSLANPYWSLWWATVGLSLTALALDTPLGWWGLVIFYVGHISSDFVWYLFVSLVVAKGRRFINDGAYRGLVGVCAAFLVFFAGYFGWFAWQQLGGA